MAGGIVIPITSREGIASPGGAGGAHYRGLGEFQGAGGGDQMGRALENFGRAVGDFGDKRFKIELQNRITAQHTALREDVLNFQMESEKWQDDYRQQYKGRDAQNAPRDYLLWNQKRARALMEKWDGIEPALAYLHEHAGTEAGRGLDNMRDYANRELDSWKDSVFKSESYLLGQKLERDPANYRQYLSQGTALIRQQYPGQDTREMEGQFKENGINAAMQSLMAAGDTTGAWALFEREAANMSPEAARKLKGAFVGEDIARAATVAAQENRGRQFMDELSALFVKGQITQDQWDAGRKQLEAATGGVNKAMEEGRKAERARALEEAEQMKAQGIDPYKTVMENPNLTAADKARWQSLASKDVSLKNPGGRELDRDIRQGIEAGQIFCEEQLQTLVDAGDPNQNLVSPEQFSKYLKDMEEAGGGKTNYYKTMLDKVTKSKDFKDDAEKIGHFTEALQTEMWTRGLSAFDPTLVDLAEGLLNDPWNPTVGDLYEENAATRRPYLDEALAKARERQNGPTTGSDFDTRNPYGAVATPQAPPARDASPDGDIITRWSKRLGLPDTPMAREITAAALRENKAPGEVTTQHMRGWRGQGHLTLPGLGHVYQWQGKIEYYARAYGIDPNLVGAVMSAESGGNPRAVSPAGAMGLMQFMPGTARDYGVEDPFDPDQSIRGACQYLSDLLSRYEGDWVKAVAAYNAGPGNTDRGVTPQETRKYVVTIYGKYERGSLPGYDTPPERGE